VARLRFAVVVLFVALPILARAENRVNLVASGRSKAKSIELKAADIDLYEDGVLQSNIVLRQVGCKPPLEFSPGLDRSWGFRRS
jgi:hypothetical protein